MLPRVSETLDRIERSGIKQLCSVLPLDDPIWSQQTLPTIADADALFKEHAISLVCRAAKGAIREWGGSMYDISHVIAVTSTNTANPGFDITLCSTLGLRPTVHRTLLYGLGCAGGLSALRIAYDLLAGAALQGLPARALVVSCDLPTLFARAELHRINVDQEVGFGMSRFSDGASAVVLTNWIGPTVLERGPIWNLLGFRSVIIKESEGYSELSIGPFGMYICSSTACQVPNDAYSIFSTRGLPNEILVTKGLKRSCRLSSPDLFLLSCFPISRHSSTQFQAFALITLVTCRTRTIGHQISQVVLP